MLGAILMSIGAGCYVFMFYQGLAAVVFLIGAICFGGVQMMERYDTSNLTIRRLRSIQIVADCLFILSGLLMIDSHYLILKLLFGNYSDYIQYLFNKWVITLLVAAILEIYTTHRLSSEMKKNEQNTEG